MAEGIKGGLVNAVQVALEMSPRRSANGISYAVYGEIGVQDSDVVRMVQAVPVGIAAALGNRRLIILCRWRWRRAGAVRLPDIAWD